MITSIINFSLILLSDDTSSSRLHNIIFLDKYIKNWNMFDHYEEKNLTKNKFYLFYGLKITYVEFLYEYLRIKDNTNILQQNIFTILTFI